MAKAVEIVIRAYDRASAQFKKVQEAVFASSKAFKDSGNQAKASTELVGTFATVLGNSGVGAFAGEIAQLTERFNAFSEVAEQSKFAAIAFRAALAGGVAVVAFKIGQAIGDIVFQTDALNRELERTKERANELNAAIASRQQSRNAERIGELEQIADAEERAAAAKELQAQIGRDVETQANKVRQLTEEIAERESGTINYLRSFWGEYEQTTEIKRQELELAKQMRANLAQQNQDLLEITAGEREREELQRQQVEAQKAAQAASDTYLQTLRDELELLRAANQEERNRIEAERNTTGGDRGEAFRLMQERDAIMAKQEAERTAREERKRAAEEEAREAERVTSVRESALDAIRRQVIALRDGEQAARAFTLQQQGLDKASANAIAAAEERLSQIREEANKTEEATKRQSGESFLAASESRLLNRGSGTNPMLQATKKTAEEAKMSNKLLAQIKQVLGSIERKDGVQLRVNSA